MLSIISLWPCMYSFKASSKILQVSFTFMYRLLLMMLLRPWLNLSMSKDWFLEIFAAIQSDSKMLNCE